MTPELLLSHFNRLSEAPGAIPRLRQFILELAVRGKLVKQSQTEELTLVAEGLNPNWSQRDALLENETDHSWPNELPRSWRWCRLGNISEQITDGEHATPPRIREQQVPLVTAKNVRDGVMAYEDTDWVSFETATKAWARCRPTVGDILLVCVGATTGRLCVLREARDMVLVRSVALIRPMSAIDVEYLALALRSPMCQAQIWKKVKATAQPCLYINRIQSLSIPLPPFSEQNAIVGKVREFMALCDRLEAAQTRSAARRDMLTAACHHQLNKEVGADGLRKNAQSFVEHISHLTIRPDQIKQVRQSILDLAIRGRLVAQDPSGETATQLLKRIQDEKERLVKTAEIKEQKRLKVKLTEHETFGIPVGWCWVTLGEIAYDFRYGTSKKCSYETKGDPVLRIPNIDNGRINIEDLKFGSLTKREADDLRLRLGDILMVRSNGSLDLVGRPGMVEPNSVDYCYAGYLVRVRTSTKYLNTRYLIFALSSVHVREQIEFPIRTSVGLKNVNAGELSALTIPLPPLLEQHRIVDKVDELMQIAQRLEEQITTVKTVGRGLLDAILNQALNSDTIGTQCEHLVSVGGKRRG